MQSMVFERTTNGVTEYAYVFAGTNSILDGIEDVYQLKGLSPQCYLAKINATKLHKFLGNSELTFLGHSLGGMLATISGLATGCNAITFNTAIPSIATRLFSSTLFKNGSSVTNYLTYSSGSLKCGDIVYLLQKALFMNYIGKIKTIPLKNFNIFESHGIEQIVLHYFPGLYDQKKAP